MSDYAEMADGPLEQHQPKEPTATPEPPKREPPYILYRPWEPPPKTGPELAHLEVQELRTQMGQMQAAMQKMQEAICHLELHVHRLLNLTRR